MMMQPANYFQSLAQPAGQQQMGGQQQQPQQPQMMVSAAPNQVAAAANAPVAMATTNAANVTPVQAAPVNAVPDDNGPFVLPDPPSDHQQERDQVCILAFLIIKVEELKILRKCQAETSLNSFISVIGLHAYAFRRCYI